MLGFITVKWWRCRPLRRPGWCGTPSIRLLTLNGDIVVARFESLTDAAFAESSQPSWTLASDAFRNGVGISYTVAVNRIAGIDLGREVLVAGFNYSLISRYMNDRVRVEIWQWMGEISEVPFSFR